MLNKLLVVLFLALGIAVVSGCNNPQAGFTTSQNLRRLTIMGEQLKVAGEDLQREAELDMYPHGGRWDY
jgi:hypothetical protein